MFCPFLGQQAQFDVVNYENDKIARKRLYPEIFNPCIMRGLVLNKPAYFYIPSRARQRWRLSLAMPRWIRVCCGPTLHRLSAVVKM